MNRGFEKTNSKRALRRSCAGNLLVLSCVALAVVCIALIMGYSFASLFFVNNRLQSSCDEIALAGAKKLNDKDRIGQMNNMVVRCRQLVYSSRRDLDDTKKLMPDLESFAEPLLTEARESADLLEKEQQNVGRLAALEANEALQRRFREIKNTYPMTLPWLTIREPLLGEIRFCRLNKVESSVEQIKGFADLDKFDEAQGYFPNEPGLKLFRAEIPDGNVRLPGADNDLTFKVSSLPAPVDGIIAPARVVLTGKEARQINGTAPSALRVGLILDVKTSLGFNAGGRMRTTSVASTTGACPQQ